MAVACDHGTRGTPGLGANADRHDDLTLHRPELFFGLDERLDVRVVYVRRDDLTDLVKALAE